MLGRKFGLKIFNESRIFKDAVNRYGAFTCATKDVQFVQSVAISNLNFGGNQLYRNDMLGFASKLAENMS